MKASLKLCLAVLALGCVQAQAAVTLAEFTVTKTWSNNTSGSKEVKVDIHCTSGTNPNLSLMVSEDQNVVFEVESIPDNAHDCTITEKVPTNYTASYNASGPGSEEGGDDHCKFFDVDASGSFTCEIHNTAVPAHIEITKTWDLAGADQGFDAGYQIKVECDHDIDWCYKPNAAGKYYLADGFCRNSDGFASKKSLKDEEGTKTQFYAFVVDNPNTDEECKIKEKSTDSVVESSFGDCGKGTKFSSSTKKSGSTEIEAYDIALSPGKTVTCEIINTVFFEGIPTLSEYSMAILALLMLGVGFVGFRRFV